MKIFGEMKQFYRIKKGLDVRLEGEAVRTLGAPVKAEEYVVRPEDFTGVVPRLVVKEGEHVLAGSPLFVDKATERVRFVSPVSGKVKAIVRGERRKLTGICIQADAAQAFKDFGKTDLGTVDAERALGLLLESGLFGFFRQRPYDVIASPEVAPKAIFVSAFSTMPLAADFGFVVKGREDYFKNGIRLLAKLAPTHIGISPAQINTPILPVNEARVSVFDGPNPSGNVGVHINHIDPVNKGETVWTIGPEAVVFIGELVATGRVNLTRCIAVAGSQVRKPRYCEAKIGTPLRDILREQLKPTDRHVRIIDGNPLVGRKASADDCLGAFTTEVCVIPEGDDRHELFGWIAPRLKEFSVSRSYFSWLMGKQRRYDLDCRIKGGERHMIMSCEYDSVFPMDIYPGYLIKAIIAGDIDRQEALGIYEIAPEDFAVAEFIDSSKLELQRIVREGLDLLRKENA